MLSTNLLPRLGSAQSVGWVVTGIELNPHSLPANQEPDT
jgi:hypothetical protein